MFTDKRAKLNSIAIDDYNAACSCCSSADQRYAQAILGSCIPADAFCFPCSHRISRLLAPPRGLPVACWWWPSQPKGRSRARSRRSSRRTTTKSCLMLLRSHRRCSKQHTGRTEAPKPGIFPCAVCSSVKCQCDLWLSLALVDEPVRYVPFCSMNLLSWTIFCGNARS